MLLAVTCRMALVCTLLLLGTALCTLETELPRERLKPVKKSPPSFGGEVSAAHIRDAFELAREREQVLAAQASIADWRKSLRKHGITPGHQEEEASLAGEPSDGQRPHRRRKKRAEHAGNEVYGKDGLGTVRPHGGKHNGTVALEGPDPDDVDDAEASVVCYGPLGCFHETDHLPEMLPSSPAEVNTRFLVYTTTHRSEKPLIEFSYEELVVAGFGAAYWSNGTNDTVSIPVSSGISSSLLKTFGDLSDRTVRVIVHGFGANCGLVWIYEMRTALMAVENCTVICVDWENGAKLPNYVRAAANTRLVGRQLALLLRLLRTHNGLRLSRVHLIGFSLGSHVAGFAGAEFSTASAVPASRRPSGDPTDDIEDDEEADDGVEDDEGGDDDGGVGESGQPEAPAASAELWRITGLDPAGPLFEAQPPEVRLDASDARYVDVIHSNGENLILGGLGSWQPMGTVDYYPNGGRVQHGCTNLFVGAVTDIIWAPPTTVEGRSLCNHRRAYKFFIDSVAPRCHFPAFPCESYDKFATGECFECGTGQGRNGTRSACGHMGYYATSREVGGYGQLYLRTRDEEPYCANQFRLRLRNAPDELPLRTVGRFELTLEGGDTGNGIGDGGGGGAGAGEEGRGPVTLITFNETFHLDETREDREFHAGQWLTTILVPHPALGHRPRALTITYRPYRGGWWQRSSVGKQLWRIGPILLTADDQKTYGACDMLTLQADVPVRLELAQIQLTPRTAAAARDQRGNDPHDHADEDDDDDNDDVGDCRVIEPLPARRPPKQPEIGATDGTSGASGGGPKSSIDELVQPGRHDHFSWTPVAISIPRQTHSDDGPQHQQPHINEKRSFSASSALDAPSEAAHPGGDGQQSRARDAAVNLPLDGTLAGTSSASATTARTSTTSTITTGPGGGAQTVQLFPSRLVSFFERAERYARRTWDALFNSNVTASDAPESATMNSVAPETITTTSTTTSASTSTIGALHSPSVPRTADRKIAGHHANEESTGTSPSSSSTEIRIALPTFRPLARTAAEGSVGSGRQHYTRFIPLVYEEEKSQLAPARPLPSANVRKGLGEAAMA
uniref:Lipase domain-containing protein n=1 Tax=Anopheles atroparvus TaxID=41427 RepID=A0A182IVH9_ANOAO